MGTMLRLRIATGVLAAAGFLAAVIALPAAHLSFISTVVLVFAAWEYATLCGMARLSSRVAAVLGVVALSVYSWWLLRAGAVPAGGLIQAWFLSGAVLWAGLLLIVLRYPRDARSLQNNALRAVLGFSTLAYAATGFSYLSAAPLGKFWIVYVVALVVVADVGAYFVGKTFGKRKLAPQVSPGKSWAGFWGGFVAAQLLAAVFYLWVFDVFLRLDSPPELAPGQRYPAGMEKMSFALFVLSAGLLSAVSVLGDLFESVMKRSAGVKDSGSLLPGHGGVLDRIDGLLSSVPVLALIVLLISVG